MSKLAQAIKVKPGTTWKVELGPGVTWEIKGTTLTYRCVNGQSDWADVMSVVGYLLSTELLGSVLSLVIEGVRMCEDTTRKSQLSIAYTYRELKRLDSVRCIGSVIDIPMLIDMTTHMQRDECVGFEFDECTFINSNHICVVERLDYICFTNTNLESTDQLRGLSIDKEFDIGLCGPKDEQLEAALMEMFPKMELYN